MTTIKRYNAESAQWETISVAEEGLPGSGIASGGTAGQILSKNSSDNYDTGWVDPHVQEATVGPSNIVAPYINGTTGVVFSGEEITYLPVLIPASSGVISTTSISFRADIQAVDSYRFIYGRNMSPAYFAAYAGVSPRFLYNDGSNIQRDTGYIAPALSGSAGMRWYRFSIDATGPDTIASVEYAADSATEPISWTTSGSVTLSGLTGITHQNLSGFASLGIYRDQFYPFKGIVSRLIERQNGNIVIDADFAAQPANTHVFRESSANQQPIRVQSTYSSFGIPSNQIIGVTTGTIGANTLHYSPFITTERVSVDTFLCELTSVTGAARNVRFGLYRANQNLQPTGAPLCDTGAILLPSDNTGIFGKTLATPVVLDPGAYLVSYIRDGACTLRQYLYPTPGGAAAAGTTGISRFYATNIAYGAFSASPPQWDMVDYATSGLIHNCRLRWTRL